MIGFAQKSSIEIEDSLNSTLNKVTEIHSATMDLKAEVQVTKNLVEANIDELRQHSRSRSETSSETSEEPKQEDTRQRTKVFGTINDHCYKGVRQEKWSVEAAPGWEIDTDSIDIKALIQSSNSSFSIDDKKTKDEFSVNGRIVNRGKCLSVFNKKLLQDARGTLHVQVTYKEKRTEW